jgi:hypothetical protein
MLPRHTQILRKLQAISLRCVAAGLTGGSYLNSFFAWVGFNFGTVKAGFKEEEAPSFVVNTLATLLGGY